VRATQIPCPYSSCQPTCIGIKPSHRNLWGTEGTLLARHMAWLYIILWFDKTFHLLLYAVPALLFYRLEQSDVFTWVTVDVNIPTERTRRESNGEYLTGEFMYISIRHWEYLPHENMSVLRTTNYYCQLYLLFVRVWVSVCVCVCVCVAVEPHKLRIEPSVFWPLFVLTTRHIFLTPESEYSCNFTNKVRILVEVFIAPLSWPLH